MNVDSSYLHPAFDPISVQTTVAGTIELIKRSGVTFDTIVFRGMSGALIAPIVAYEMGKFLSVCRKKSDDTHSGYRDSLEGNRNIEKYIIVDDFTSTGNTVNIILNVIKKCKVTPRFPAENKVSETAKCVGIFLYRSCRRFLFVGMDGEEIPVFSHELNGGQSLFFMAPLDKS